MANPTLLCVANYPANTGYAWDFIERLYAGIADRVAVRGMRTLVAYPSISEAPRTLMGSAAQPIVLDARLNSSESVRRTVDLIRRENVRVVYLTDQPVRSWAYLRLRWAGVKYIIVHDHSSGERTRPRALKRSAKWIIARLPGIVADLVITVSDYVARRQTDVGMIPANRVVRVWNGISVPPVDPAAQHRVRQMFGLASDRPVIACACRAAPEKGVDHLLRAFDTVARNGRVGSRPVLVYVGDGPHLQTLRNLRTNLKAHEDIILVGYRPDATSILEGADLCVVPSVWQDAFPLAVLEAMAHGKAVIATRVGGIPEMVEHGVTGLLVPPADEHALTAAIQLLISNPAEADRLAINARKCIAERFTPEIQLQKLTSLVLEGFPLDQLPPLHG